MGPGSRDAAHRLAGMTPVLLRRLPLPDRGVDLRHYLLGEQLHVASPKIAVLPVLAGHQQGAEIADLLAERQYLVRHAVGRAPEHQLVADRIKRDFFVWLVLPRLERDMAVAALQLGVELAVVVAIR